jgi:hypothetical protein
MKKTNPFWYLLMVVVGLCFLAAGFFPSESKQSKCTCDQTCVTLPDDWANFADEVKFMSNTEVMTVTFIIRQKLDSP